MNRIEALQAAFNIAGPNVTAEEHIRYAEFLLGEHTVVLENRITRGYTPHDFIGEYVDEAFDDDYPVGVVALDDDHDVHVKVGISAWERWDRNRGYGIQTDAENARHFNAAFVA